MIVEKDGTVSYAENEASPKDVNVSIPGRQTRRDERVDANQIPGLLCRDYPQQALNTLGFVRK